ncbi:hypothetical protein [Clostridium butyricum]|uniref:hypothetical protein n=1 Tax=Clostridium butyricum TaxID=1492 RepID=UPI002ABD4AB1|nr:hypothetical protein [Clostridium butyricum]
MNKDKKTIKLDDKLLEIDTDYNLLSGTDNEIIDSLKKSYRYKYIFYWFMYKM